MNHQKRLLGLIIFLTFLYSNVYPQLSYEEEASLVEKQMDVLSLKYGKSDKEKKKQFIQSITNYSFELFKGNLLDRNEIFESYLNKIAVKINPDFKSGIYLYKSAFANAFTTFRGEIFLHWGLIADAKNEASLAYTIGHEIGHYYGAHIYKSFISEAGHKNLDRDEVLKMWHSEQNQEYYSDSLGFELASKVGYDWTSGLSGFYEYLSVDTILNELEKKGNIFNAEGELMNDIYYNEQSDTLFSSHPPTRSRINSRKRMGKSIPLGFEYIVSQNDFKKIQAYSRLMVLEHFLNEKQYKYGLIKAFKYYCLDPSNSKLKYYLIEFIRRKYHNSYAVLKRGFLSDIFHLEQNKSVYSNLRWIFRDKSDLAQVRREIITEIQNKGITYNSLLSFLSEDTGTEYPEFYLSLALLNHKDDKKKSYYISKYLAQDNIQFREFADSYQKEELIYSLRVNDKNLLLYDGVTQTKRTLNGSFEDEEFDKAYKYNEKIQKFVENKGNKKNWKCISINELDKSEESYFIKHNLLAYMYSKAYSYNDNGGLKISGTNSEYLISPEIWTFLNENKFANVSICSGLSIKDETVSFTTNFRSHFTSLKNISFEASNQYYGLSRNSYVFRWVNLDAYSFGVTSLEERVKSKLTLGAIKTEIVLNLK